MTVHCLGDRRLLEQVGEKRDFECELSRLGLPHELFTLRVQRAAGSGEDAAWDHDYSVSVAHTGTAATRVYTGGPRRQWIAAFAEDLRNGAFGIVPRAWGLPGHTSSAPSGATRARSQ